MNNRLNILLATAAAAVIFSSCIDDDNPAPPREQQTERTVLVYMVANNSLGNYGCDAADLAEMQSAAANLPENTRWLVYHDPVSDDMPVLKELTADGWKTLKSYDREQLSVQAARMSDVIGDAKDAAPALSYGLVLWSHAHGWLQNGLSEEPRVSPCSFGDDGGRTMNITTLASVLDNQGFDYIYADCCYMAAVEVAYELRDAARYFVASPSELPIDGQPYDLNLPLLADGSAEALNLAAINTFNHYDALIGSGRTCTISVIDLAAIGRLATLTAGIYADRSVTYDDGYIPQRYMTESNCYYYDFEDYITHHRGLSEAVAVSWRRALDDAVIYEAATPYLWNRLAVEHHCGLSTYMLRTEDAAGTKNYNTLSWWNDVASLKFRPNE